RGVSAARDDAGRPTPGHQLRGENGRTHIVGRTPRISSRAGRLDVVPRRARMPARSTASVRSATTIYEVPFCFPFVSSFAFFLLSPLLLSLLSGTRSPCQIGRQTGFLRALSVRQRLRA